ncbi:MAG: hypothetical protein SVU32_07390, partial [Candidatus Nanohaloarchaea archaeon]|nr:hypothetical protein [Candidatus Nanohaloarchaea archaeon]
MDRGQKLIMLGVILAVLIAPAVAYEGQINSVSKWQANPCYGHWENGDNWVKDGCQETWHIWDSDYNDRQPTFILNIDGEFAPSTGCFTFKNRIIVYHEGSKVSDSGWHTDKSCKWENVL